MDDARQGPALVRRRAIAEGPLAKGLGQPLIDQSDVHRRAAGAPAGALQGLSQLCLSAAWGAVCTQHPPKRRQRPEGESCADGLTLRTQSPWAHLLPLGHRVGGESLGQRWRGHLRLRMTLAPDVTETCAGDRGVFQHCRRHQLDAILATLCPLVPSPASSAAPFLAQTAFGRPAYRAECPTPPATDPL